MPKKGARKPQTCLTQKTVKPSPSISNLHPPFSTRSLWIKGQTFRVKMEDLLCQPAGRDAKAFGEMPRWPCWVFVGKNTAPPLCHPSLSAKHCGFALHDIQDEPSKAKTMLHVFIRFSNDSAPDSDHKDIMRFCSRTAELVWYTPEQTEIFSILHCNKFSKLMSSYRSWYLKSPNTSLEIESRKICCSAIYGQAWHPPFLIFTILAWSVLKGKTLQMENTEIKKYQAKKIRSVFSILHLQDQWSYWQNPKSFLDMVNIPLFTGFHTSQVVSRISEPWTAWSKSRTDSQCLIPLKIST